MAIRWRIRASGWMALGILMAVLPAPALGGETDDAVYVVRFAQRITDASRASLAATGVQIIDYEPPDGYLVWADPTLARAAERLEEVRSVLPMPPARKLSIAPSADDRFVLADVTVYQPALEPTRDRLAALGEVIGPALSGADGTRSTLAVRLPADALALAAESPGVLAIGPAARGPIFDDEMTSQVVAGNIDPADNRPFPGYSAWLDRHGLDGEGVKVAIVDTGISALHPDFGDRVERPAGYTVAGQSADIQGHGTHVAGIVGGAPPRSFQDPDGFEYGTGVAPAARLVDLNTTLELVNSPGGGDRMGTLARDTWRSGARMWNASWHTGIEPLAGYTATTRMMDVLSRNADLETPGSEELLLVFSAGNTGVDGPMEPHEAKNIVPVGSTGSGRAQYAPGVGTGEGDIDAVSSFSSRGPTADGRYFPVVTAPGGWVVSARAPERLLHLSGTNCLPPAEGAGLYAACSGTSMAAPQVAGASALIHQWWRQETGNLPSPAMVKALLVNGTTDIGDQSIPDNDEGWGRINLRGGLADLPPLWDDQSVIFTERDQESFWVVESDGSEPLRATLAWSDAPAAVGANPALVNDLDLVVERLDDADGASGRWHGNVFSGGASVAGGTPDRLNNLENVHLMEPEPGTYRISVRAHNVPGDGIPENSDTTDQDFALVVRGATPPPEGPSPPVAIQPGAAIATTGTCAVNWIYDRVVAGDGSAAPADKPDAVYAGVSACAGDVGDDVYLATPEGEPPLRIGTVAFRGPPELGRYGFVQIDDEVMPLVDPALRGHPGIPTGISTVETARHGDSILYVGDHLQGEQEYEGILNFTDGQRHGIIAGIPPGSSDGPIANLTDGKKALGYFYAYDVFAEPAHAGPAGWSLEGLLADARSRGWDMRLRHVDDEP